MEGVDARGFLVTVKAFNEAVDQTKAFNPNVKDGRRTNGLAIEVRISGPAAD